MNDVIIRGEETNRYERCHAWVLSRIRQTALATGVDPIGTLENQSQVKLILGDHHFG